MPIPVLTVVTVCRNAREALQATVQNVLAQTWTQFEYLVIDGASMDGTPKLLGELPPQFAQAGISFHFVSEKDQGIYDAMNKGSKMARGTWLLFLNAGDLFAAPDVLERVFKQPARAQILYGDTLCTYQGRRRLYPALPLEHLKYEMAFCHQSAFIQRELLLRHPYDISYRICADHHFFLKMYLLGISFEYQSFPVSIYEIAGVSDSNKLLSHREQRRMQQELGIFRLSFPWMLREIFFYLKLGIKKLFGRRLIDLVRRSRSDS